LWGEISRRKRIEAVLLDAYDQSPRPGDEPGRVNAVGGPAGVALYPVCRAPQQLCRPDRIAPTRVGEAHGDLGQTPPQFTLVVGRGLPRALQHLVRLERAARIEELLRLRERVRRPEREVVGHALDPRGAARQRPTQLVPRPAAPRPSGAVPVPPGLARF